MVVGVGVDFTGSVNMPVSVEQAGPLQQFRIAEHRRRCSLRNEPTRLEHEAMVGDFLNAIQIVRGGDHRAPGALPPRQQVNRLTLTLGSSVAVGSSSNNTSGSSTSTEAMATRFFSPPARRCGARSHGWRMSMDSSIAATRSRIVSRAAQLQGAERHFFKNSRVEELHVGVLKDHAAAAPKAERELFILQPLFGQRFGPIMHRPGFGDVQAVWQSEQGRFSGAVGPQEGDAYSLVNCQ